MAELADALDSGSSEGFLHAGSSPVSRTSPSAYQALGFFVSTKTKGRAASTECDHRPLAKTVVVISLRRGYLYGIINK